MPRTTKQTLIPPTNNQKPPHWNAKYDQFCISIVAGAKKMDAYFGAGFVDNYKGRQSDGPSRLLKMPQIQERIAYLRAVQAMRLNVTMDSLILELERARQIAEQDINPAAMVAATLAKAKLLGFLVEGVSNDGKIPKPSLIPTDAVEMSEEEWLAKFKPATKLLN